MPPDPTPPERSSGLPDRRLPNRVLPVSRSCNIPLSELDWRFSASGGPGGQHANTANTRAEVVFDVANSPSLGPRQRARLTERLGPVVRVVADDERSQARNRQLALDRLAARLREALKVERPRVATRPSAGARARRLDSKRRTSQRKKMRRPPEPE
ncbi:MAG: ribosome-associated protein [Actinomycetota bacterium]|nr:ribosome-associated protein [Actinomycetota bacterium]